MLGSNGEDSGPGKENEDWRAKVMDHSTLVATSGDIGISHIHNQTIGAQITKADSNLQSYHLTTNYMLNNLGAKPKDKSHLSSLTNGTEKESAKEESNQTDRSSACNNNSSSSRNSPLQPRRGTKWTLWNTKILRLILNK